MLKIVTNIIHLLRTDAVIDPLAVMVMPLHAFVTEQAVFRGRSACDLTSGTQHSWVHGFHER